MRQRVLAQSGNVPHKRSGKGCDLIWSRTRGFGRAAAEFARGFRPPFALLSARAVGKPAASSGARYDPRNADLPAAAKLCP
jgi:hypothetical protein